MAERFALARRDPYDIEFDRFMDRAMSVFDMPIYRTPRTLLMERPLVAPMEVFDTDDNTVVRVEVPGMTMDDIDISVSDGLLTIKGEKKAATEMEEEGCYCSERIYGSFRRTLSVPKSLNESDIHATYENGVLEIVLPKAEETKEHKVRIQTKKSGK